MIFNDFLQKEKHPFGCFTCVSNAYSIFLSLSRMFCFPSSKQQEKNNHDNTQDDFHYPFLLLFSKYAFLFSSQSCSGVFWLKKPSTPPYPAGGFFKFS